MIMAIILLTIPPNLSTYDEATRLKVAVSSSELELSLLPAPRPPAGLMPLRPKAGDTGRLPPTVQVLKTLDNGRFFGRSTLPVGRYSTLIKLDMVFVSAPGVDAEDGPFVYIGNIPAWVAVPQFGQVGHYGWYQYPVLEPVPYSKSELEYRAKKKELDSVRCAYEKSKLSLSVKDRQRLDDYRTWDGVTSSTPSGKK
jgi:hypothetical protein